MEIRQLLPQDIIDDVSRVFALSWKDAYRGIVPQNYLDNLALNRWSVALEKERFNLWVAEDNGQIVGVASHGAARDEQYPAWGELRAIYLLPTVYRMGIGSKLLHASMQSLFNAGYDDIYLWVLEENHVARRFYEKNGFSFHGEKMPHPIGGKPLTVVRYIYHKS